jgi:hypothetical protein
MPPDQTTMDIAVVTAKEFYITIGGAVVLLAALQWLIATLLKVRIEQSVKAEYDRQLDKYRLELNKQLEDYKNEAKVREQAAKVAEFLAFVRWNQQGLDGFEFDRRAWELSLWLPTQIYVEISKCLAGDDRAMSMKHILIEVRKHLLKENAGALVADNILHRA